MREVDDEKQILLLLGELRSDVKTCLKSIESQKQDTKEDVDEVKNRVSKLEDLTANMRVKIASFSCLAGAVVAIVAELIKKGGS